MLRVVARADASIGQILGYHYLNQACIAFYGDRPGGAGPLVPPQRRGSSGSGATRSTRSAPTSPSVADGRQLPAQRPQALRDRGRGDRRDHRRSDRRGRSARRRTRRVRASTRAASGVEHLDDWDNLGQRASASGSVRYTDVLVTPDDVIGVDRSEPFSSLVTPGVQLLFGNIYLARRRRARWRRQRELTLARKNSWFLSGVERYADDPHIHRLFGGLVAPRSRPSRRWRIASTRTFDDALARGAATTAEDRAAVELEIAALKVVSTEVGLEVTRRVFEAAGASATKNSHRARRALAQHPHPQPARPGRLQEDRSRRALPQRHRSARVASTPDAGIVNDTVDDEASLAKYRPVFERDRRRRAGAELQRELPFEPIELAQRGGFTGAAGAGRVRRRRRDPAAALPCCSTELAAADPNVPQALRGHFAFVEDRLNARRRRRARRLASSASPRRARRQRRDRDRPGRTRRTRPASSRDRRRLAHHRAQVLHDRQHLRRLARRLGGHARTAWRSPHSSPALRTA